MCFRVPAAYLTSVFLSFFSVLVFRRISNLCGINPRRGFDSTPGTVFFALNQLMIYRLETFTRLNFRAVLMLESKRNQTIRPYSIRKV
jgi:hypothetical protein